MQSDAMNPGGHGEKKSRKRQQTIAALLECSTIAAAAKAVGVSTVTVWRWLQDEAFAGEYASARRAAVAHSSARLQQASGEAVTCLRAVMADDDAPASARVTAAAKVLELSLRALEAEVIEERLAALESRVAEQKGGPKAWGR